MSRDARWGRLMRGGLLHHSGPLPVVGKQPGLSNIMLSGWPEWDFTGKGT